MPPLRLVIQEGKVRNLQENYEAWEKDHLDAMFASDAEVLVKECLTLANGTEAFWRALKADLANVPSAKLDEVGHSIDRIFRNTLQLLTDVKRYATLVAQKTGHDIAGLQELDAPIDAIESLRSRIMKNWPWENTPWQPLSPEKRARMRSGNDGPGEDVRDILRRLNAGGEL